MFPWDRAENVFARVLVVIARGWRWHPGSKAGMLLNHHVRLKTGPHIDSLDLNCDRAVAEQLCSTFPQGVM